MNKRTAHLSIPFLLFTFTALAAEPGDQVSDPVVSTDDARVVSPILSLEEVFSMLGGKITKKETSAKVLPAAVKLWPADHTDKLLHTVAGTDIGDHREISYLKKDESCVGHCKWKRFDNDKEFDISVYADHILIHEIRIPGHNMHIVYDPGEPLIVSGLKLNEVHVREIGVTAFSLKKASKVRGKGAMKMDYLYMGEYDIETDASKQNTYLIRIDIDSKVGPVHQVDTIYNFYAMGVGLVAQVSRLDVRAVLIYHKDRRNAYLISNLAEAAAKE